MIRLLLQRAAFLYESFYPHSVPQSYPIDHSALFAIYFMQYKCICRWYVQGGHGTYIRQGSRLKNP